MTKLLINIPADAGTEVALDAALGTPGVSSTVLIGSERMAVSSGLGTPILQVERGAQSTTPAAHAVGATVTWAATAASAVAPLSFATLVPAGGTAGDIITTGTSWPTFPAAGACGGKLLLENSCNTGEFATWRMRARSANTTASGNGNNSVGTTTCIDASASAVAAEYGNLKAVNACAQPLALAQTTDATNIVCALYGRIDATAGSVGRRWVTWIDTHATTKADASDYLVRLSHNGTIAIDGAFTIYSGGRLPVLFNFEDVAGFLSGTPGTLTPTHKIAVNIAGVGVRYLQVGTVA